MSSCKKPYQRSEKEQSRCTRQVDNGKHGVTLNSATVPLNQPTKSNVKDKRQFFYSAPNEMNKTTEMSLPLCATEVYRFFPSDENNGNGTVTVIFDPLYNCGTATFSTLCIDAKTQTWRASLNNPVFYREVKRFKKALEETKHLIASRC